MTGQNDVPPFPLRLNVLRAARPEAAIVRNASHTYHMYESPARHQTEAGSPSLSVRHHSPEIIQFPFDFFCFAFRGLLGKDDVIVATLGLTESFLGRNHD